MELVCKKCGYKQNLGKYVSVQDVFVCTECGSKDLKLVDTGGVNIKVDGITEDVIVDIIKELTSNISLTDIVGFFSKLGKQDNQEENK